MKCINRTMITQTTLPSNMRTLLQNCPAKCLPRASFNITLTAWKDYCQQEVFHATATRLLLLAAVLTICSPVTEASIRITDIFVPPLKMAGEDAELECLYSKSGGDKLYSIKWWRDSDQFYQYIPRNVPPKLPFNVSGITVNTSASTAARVVLEHVGVQTAGVYTCEVIADDSFETVRRSANMTVIDPPDGGGGPGSAHRAVGPVIRVSGRDPLDTSPLEYRPGQMFEALCIASRAYPPADLTWSINGKRVPKHFLLPLQSSAPRPEAFNTFTTELYVKFQVEEHLFDSHGHMQLSCNATLARQYHTSAHILLRNPLMRRPTLSGFFSQGCQVSPGGVLWLCLAILVVSSGLLGCPTNCNVHEQKSICVDQRQSLTAGKLSRVDTGAFKQINKSNQFSGNYKIGKFWGVSNDLFKKYSFENSRKTFIDNTIRSVNTNITCETSLNKVSQYRIDRANMSSLLCSNGYYS